MRVRLRNIYQTNFLNYTSLNAIHYLVQIRRQMESNMMANSSSYGSINFSSLCKSGKANEQFLRNEHHEAESRSQEDTENNGKQKRPTV
jgi:hypothetical protein